jgi:hypothetical protein
MAHAGQPAKVARQVLTAAVEEARQSDRELAVKFPVAGEQALVQQADAQLDVALMQLAALRGRPHRVAQAQLLVPQSPQETGDGLAARLGSRDLLDQQEQVHV